MKILVNGRIYLGSASEIVLKLRDMLFDPMYVPDVETYIGRMQHIYRSVMECEMQLPASNTETRAQAMFEALEDIGVLEILKEDT